MTGEGKKAFTLAEVLITLGIIGVVAAMTIPTLVANYNTKQWNTAATVFERKLEEALKTMNTQSTLAGHTTTESFVEELSKHFKTNKICSNDKLLDCFSETVYWGGGEATPEEVDMSIVKTAKNFGQKDWGTNIVGVQFANGTSAMIAYNPTNTCTQDPYSNQITGESCLAILYDTSGAKNPNQSAKDLRSINVTKLGKGCFAEINGVCISIQPQIAPAHVWNYCYEDGTTPDPEDQKFMAEYGITSCNLPYGWDSAVDYWAGAVKLCGGVSKMASQSDLAKIANYVYNTDSIGSNAIWSLTFDESKAASLGITSPPTYVWSNELYDGRSVYVRNFGSSGTSVGYGSEGPRETADRLTICVE